MRHIIFAVVLCCSTGSAVAQPDALSNEALLSKTRALYDAPFERNLVSFDCAVQFNWSQHFIDSLGAVPPGAGPTLQQLQGISHRVFVDDSHVVVSSQPEQPDLTGLEHAADLERIFKGMVPSGLGMWMPFSTNVILPTGSTRFSFEKIDPGYKLSMNGIGVAATLLLTNDLRITSFVSQLPQTIRATTEFTQGPNGFLLSSITTGPTTDPAARGDATFSYTYQTVKGFQLPSLVTMNLSPSEIWRYTLTDCKVTAGVAIQVGPPPSSPD